MSIASRRNTGLKVEYFSKERGLFIPYEFYPAGREVDEVAPVHFIDLCGSALGSSVRDSSN